MHYLDVLDSWGGQRDVLLVGYIGSDLLRCIHEP